MVVNDFNVCCSATVKSKADSPLIVDANTPLAKATPSQGFQPIGRRLSQVLQLNRRTELGQPHHCASQDVWRKTARFACGEQTLGFYIREALDHVTNYKQFVYNRLQSLSF